MNRSTKTLYVYMTVCYMKNNYVMLSAAISPSVCPITAFDRNSHLRRSVCDQLRVLLARERERERARENHACMSRAPLTQRHFAVVLGVSLSLSLSHSLSLSLCLSLALLFSSLIFGLPRPTLLPVPIF